MSARLSVVFYIILCLEIGLVLTLMPWIPQGLFGLSDWGNNYFLLYAARKTGFYGLQTVVASGWVRGAVTGVGVLNLGIAFWEMFHFKQTVSALQREAELPVPTGKAPENNAANDAVDPAAANNLSDHKRRDAGGDNSVQ
jgi:hypothetical protein